MSEAENEDYEEYSYFSGGCTCEHEQGDHTWGSCGIEDDDGNECPCEAGWEE